MLAITGPEGACNALTPNAEERVGGTALLENNIAV